MSELMRESADGWPARVLLLSPSHGLGGGIERYVETLEWAFTEEGIGYWRIDLRGPGAAAHSQMFTEAWKHLRSSREPARLILGHPSLLPVAVALSRERSVRGISVVCHGCEVWGTGLRPRRYIERCLMRWPAVRVVAVSNFTSGALFGGARATILPPGLSGDWFDALVKASTSESPREPGIALITAFRLTDWWDKGLPQILDAVAALERPDVRLTVCGSGEPSLELLRLVDNYERCVLRVGLTDTELAHEFAQADLFILATRTRQGRQPYGEGFGLALLEAQVAGTPVIGPAYGGSYEAFVDQVTGVAPVDESTEALVKVLDELVRDPSRLAQMSKQASEWARGYFLPEHYASRVVGRLL
jgi:phosphatidyl-myo-inositol dimannoside synthase